MKKIVIGTIIITSMLIMQVSAQERNYIGLDLGNTTAEATITSTGLGINESEDDDGGSQTLKFGHYYNDQNRAYLFFHNINAEDADFNMLGIGYDYLMGENDLKPFVGVMLGYGRYDLNDYNFEIDGAVYGVQAGVNYEINKNFSLDAGYRFLKSTLNETYRDGASDADFAIDDFRNWYIGLNYSFN